MKKLMILFLLLGLFSCENEDENSDISLDGSWQLKKLIDSKGQSFENDWSRIKISREKMSIVAPCNTGNGIVTVDDRTISVDGVATTNATCPEISLENLILSGLSGSYTISSERLTISSEIAELIFIRIE